MPSEGSNYLQGPFLQTSRPRLFSGRNGVPERARTGSPARQPPDVESVHPPRSAYIALACDITVAAEGTRFGEPEVRFSTGIVAMLLPRTVLTKHAQEMLQIGNDKMDASRAPMGIVNHVGRGRPPVLRSGVACRSSQKRELDDDPRFPPTGASKPGPIGPRFQSVERIPTVGSAMRAIFNSLVLTFGFQPQLWSLWWGQRGVGV